MVKVLKVHSACACSASCSKYWQMLTNIVLTPRFRSFLFDIFARRSHVLRFHRFLLGQHDDRWYQNVTNKCIFSSLTTVTNIISEQHFPLFSHRWQTDPAYNEAANTMISTEPKCCWPTQFTQTETSSWQDTSLNMYNKLSINLCLGSAGQ